MSDLDLTDIARGRRITAVTASELEIIPRRSARPKNRSAIFRLARRLNRLLLRVSRQH